MDYYETLGISKNSTREEIKKAYKKLAKKYHPDINKDPSAEKKFKEINEAAATLGDEQKRAQYDNLGHDTFKNASRGGGFDTSGFNFNQGFGGFDFEDIFESFFGGRRTKKSNRGRDLETSVNITLSEVGEGVEKKITLRKSVLCHECQGKGGYDFHNCQTCKGRGRITIQRQTPFGIFQSTKTCHECQGKGEIPEKNCTFCKGNGFVNKETSIKVDIPAGIHDGTALRLSGEGNAGTPPGDLFIHVNVEEHPLFKREDNDLILEAPISFIQATIGGVVGIPTLNGKAELKIPSGTESETIFRMKNKGLPKIDGYGRGDQYVKVKIVVPKKLTKEQTKLIKQLADSMGKEANPGEGIFSKFKKFMS